MPLYRSDQCGYRWNYMLKNWIQHRGRWWRMTVNCLFTLLWSRITLPSGLYATCSFKNPTECLWWLQIRYNWLWRLCLIRLGLFISEPRNNWKYKNRKDNQGLPVTHIKQEKGTWSCMEKHVELIQGYTFHI